MTSQTVANQTYCQINKLINSSRFNEAFAMLKSRMKNFKSLTKELNNIKDSEYFKIKGTLFKVPLINI